MAKFGINVIIDNDHGFVKLVQGGKQFSSAEEVHSIFPNIAKCFETSVSTVEMIAEGREMHVRFNDGHVHKYFAVREADAADDDEIDSYFDDNDDDQIAIEREMDR